MKKKALCSVFFITYFLCNTYSMPSDHWDTAHDSNQLAADLLQAVAEGNEHRVVRLLMQDAPFDYLANNTSPLMLAAHNGYPEIIAILLAANANPNLQHRGGWTALAHAAYQGYVHIVDQLLTAGARIDQEVFKYHSFKGSYDNRCNYPPGSVLRHRPRYFKTTALHCAAQNGHDRVVHFLLSSGAHKEHQDHYKRTPLIVAAQYNHIKTIQILIHAGVQLCTKDKELNTAMHYAALAENSGALKALIRAGAHLNQINKQGKTPLWLATTPINTSTIKTLLKYGAHLPVPAALTTAEYLTIGLHVDLYHKHVQKVQQFLEKIEDMYGVPRDITRVICAMADVLPEHIPQAPCSTQLTNTEHSPFRHIHPCTVL